MTLEQKLMFDLVYEFVSSAQIEARKSAVCCNALAYLSETLTDAEFEALKARLPDQ